MKALLSLCVLAFVGAVGWQIGGTLSSDALGMAIGILFGIMAGIPVTLMLLASARREDEIRYQTPPARPQEPQPILTIENHYHLHVHGAHKPIQNGQSIAKTERTQQHLSIPKYNQTMHGFDFLCIDAYYGPTKSYKHTIIQTYPLEPPNNYEKNCHCQSKRGCCQNHHGG